MARKIYDIKPPKVTKKITASAEVRSSRVVGEAIQEPVTKEKKSRKPQTARRKKENRSIWWPISIGVIIVLLAVGIYLFFALPKANIVIWPKLDVLSFKQAVVADKSVDFVDITKSVIPAQYFQATKTNSQKFPATGSASNGNLASGVITIYNKYDPPTPFNFKAGTHFMSDSGKLFVALQKIAIPAAKKSGSKITPGSVKIEIQAVEVGSGYNIAPANFSIPGLKGTAFYYSVNATSTSPMTGGYSGKVKKVTDDDIQGAKDILTKDTKSDALVALKGQISSDYVLLDNAVSSSVASASTQTKPGAIADDFNYQVTVTASALAFKKSDLDKFVKNYIVSQIPQGKTSLYGSLKTNYSAGIVDISGGKENLNLDFSTNIYQNIDKNSTALSLLGKNDKQIREVLNSILGDQLSKVQIEFWPFWVSLAPKNQGKVNVDLKFQ